MTIPDGNVDGARGGNRWSDPQALIDELAGHVGVLAECLIFGNGSVDVIAAIVRGTLG